MKSLLKLLALLILIGCGNKTQDQNQAMERIELMPEPDVDTQVHAKEDNEEDEPNTKCFCEGLVDWQKDEKVKLFDQPNGQLVNVLTNDIEGENFLIFTIVDSIDKFFKVKIGRAIEGKQHTGWIEKAEYLGTYARNYSDNETMFLYSKPGKESNPSDTINVYYTELYTITDCKGKWAKVIVKTSENRAFKGWIEPEMQCSSPYTTCN